MALTYHHVTVAGAGNNNGLTWANAMAMADFQTHVGTSLAAGHIFFVEEGTYTLTADIYSVTDGTQVDPIAIIGVLSGTSNEGAAIDDSDFATGANRPHFDGGASYGVYLDDYAHIRNISVQTADAYAIRVDVGGVIANCKGDNDYTGASAKWIIYLGGTSAQGINNEAFQSGVAAGVEGSLVTSSSCAVILSYYHDMPTALVMSGGAACPVLFCIFDNCTEGINRTADHGSTIFGCTFYDCDTAILGTTDYGFSIINNIFSDCSTDAIKLGTAANAVTMMYNHFYNNGDDFDGVPEEGDAADLFCDWWKTTGDPKFSNPDGGDFNLNSDSPCIDAGMTLELGVG